MAEQRLKKSKDTAETTANSNASDSPLELLSLVQQSLQKHLELEAKYEQLEDFQSSSTKLLETIIQKLDAQSAPNLEAFQQELAELRKDATSKIGGLQTALTLNHEKQFELEAQKEGLNKQLDDSKTEIGLLQEKINNLEDRCAAVQREVNVLQSAKQSVINQRDELECENKRLQDQLVLANHNFGTGIAENLLDHEEPTIEEPENETEPESDSTPEAPQNAESDPNNNQQFWESQKTELYKKYGLDLPEDDTPSVDMESDTIPPLATFLQHLSEKNVDDSEEDLTADSTEELAVDESSTAISVIEESDSIKSKNISPIIPVVENPTNEDDELARRKEVELALERARISRKRKALEDKIVALKSEMSTEKENKGGLLSRMKKFLGRDNSEHKEVEEMKAMLDAKNEELTASAPTYDDPRDHPFFKVDIDEVRRLAAENDVQNVVDDSALEPNEQRELDEKPTLNELPEAPVEAFTEIKSPQDSAPIPKEKKAGPRSRSQKKADDSDADPATADSANLHADDPKPAEDNINPAKKRKSKNAKSKKPRRSRRRR